MLIYRIPIVSGYAILRLTSLVPELSILDLKVQNATVLLEFLVKTTYHSALGGSKCNIYATFYKPEIYSILVGETAKILIYKRTGKGEDDLEYAVKEFTFANDTEVEFTSTAKCTPKELEDIIKALLLVVLFVMVYLESINLFGVIGRPFKRPAFNKCKLFKYLLTIA